MRYNVDHIQIEKNKRKYRTLNITKTPFNVWRNQVIAVINKYLL